MTQKKTLLAMLGGAAVGALAAWASLPAHTPGVRRQKGKGEVQALEAVPVTGGELWTLQRGADRNNPILLVVHGGPGLSEMAMNRANYKALEQHYTVVQYDQRGAGKSRAAGQDAGLMNIPQFVDDLAEIAGYLLQKFGQQKLTLLGRSWGTAISMLAVKTHPQLFHAYVGIGQIARTIESELLSYNWALEQALSRKNKRAARRLMKIGPPPYEGNWLPKFVEERHYVCLYGGEVRGNPMGGNLMLGWSVLTGAEYTLADKLAYTHAAMRSMRLLQPPLMELDLFETAAEVDVPLFFIAGRHDHVVPQVVAQRYCLMVAAPHKEWHWLEHSAHMPDFEEQEKFLRLMTGRVLPFSKAVV